MQLDSRIRSGASTYFVASLEGETSVWRTDDGMRNAEPIYQLTSDNASLRVVGEHLAILDDRRLLLSEGTPETTRQVHEFETSLDLIRLTFHSVGNQFLFWSRDTLLSSIGRDANVVASFSDRPGGQFAALGKLFFVIDSQLWVSDGTSTGTRRVSQEVQPDLDQVVEFDDRLFF